MDTAGCLLMCLYWKKKKPALMGKSTQSLNGLSINFRRSLANLPVVFVVYMIFKTFRGFSPELHQSQLTLKVLPYLSTICNSFLIILEIFEWILRDHWRTNETPLKEHRNKWKRKHRVPWKISYYLRPLWKTIARLLKDRCRTIVYYHCQCIKNSLSEVAQMSWLFLFFRDLLGPVSHKSWSLYQGSL